MALRIRRGTDAQRTGKTFEMGEIVYTTDSQQMWVGDGSTQGGIPVVGSNVAGYGLTYNNISHKIQVAGLFGTKRMETITLPIVKLLGLHLIQPLECLNLDGRVCCKRI